MSKKGLEKMCLVNVYIKFTRCYCIVGGCNGVIKKVFNFEGFEFLIIGNILLLKLSVFNKIKYPLWGTYKSIISNMIHGVQYYYCKSLMLIGVGYKTYLLGTTLAFNIGFSHIIYLKIPSRVLVSINKVGNKVSVCGISKFLVGLFASRIRLLKKYNVYKGKGIKYSNENIPIKVSKKK